MKKLSYILILCIFCAACGTTTEDNGKELGLYDYANITDGGFEFADEAEATEEAVAEGGTETYTWQMGSADQEILYNGATSYFVSTDVSTNAYDADVTTTSGGSNAATKPKAPAKNIEKIIKEADINMSVEDYAEARKLVGQHISKHGGYIVSENEQKSSYEIANRMTIRVKQKAFDNLVSGIAGEAYELNTKAVNAKDVTDEFVDIQTRLKTKKAVEKRYLEILKQAKTIEDILRVEDKLRVIREEIESREGRLKFLSDKVSYSTINLYFYQNYDRPQVKQKGFFSKLGKAFAGGWKGLLNLVIGLVYAWPFVLVVIAAFVFITKWIRKRRKG